MAISRDKLLLPGNRFFGVINFAILDLICTDSRLLGWTVGENEFCQSQRDSVISKNVLRFQGICTQSDENNTP